MKFLLFFLLIYWLTACAESPKKNPSDWIFNLSDMRLERPLVQLFLNLNFLNTEVEIVLDTQMRIGLDSVRLFCLFKYEEMGLLQTSYWNGKNWTVTNLDTVSLHSLDFLDFQDFNNDQLQDIKINTVLAGNGWIPRGVTIFLYDSFKHQYKMVTNTDIHTSQGDVENCWNRSKTDTTYFYAYTNTGGCCEQEVTLGIGFLDSFNFKKIAYATWTFDWEQDIACENIQTPCRNDIKIYLSKQKKPFASIPYFQKKSFEDNNILYSFMLAYFEKNLPTIIQKHNARK